MILRPATTTEALALAELGAETFIAAFLAEVHGETAVAAEIAGDSCTHRLVEIDGTLVAFCKLRHPSHYTAYSDARDPIELGQLYALPSHTGTGIGARLMDWVLEEARDGGHDAVLLSVYAKNFGAQRFYQRYGFSKIADITFKVGEQLDPEFLYELKL